MYTIGDFLIQVKNAYQAGKRKIIYPHSKVVEGIAAILEKEGLVAKVALKSEKTKAGAVRKFIEIDLKYTGRIPAFVDVKLLSKPSVHRYIDASGLVRGIARQGVTILSTSSGIMTGKEARKKGVGGELICHIF